MIEQSFKFLHGFNRELQREMHRRGIRTWSDFLERESVEGIPDDVKSAVDNQLREMSEALENKEYRYFAKNIPPSSHWRLYRRLKDERRLCYMDIETTGLQFFNDEVTVVGIFDGSYHQALIAGVDLTAENIRTLLSPFDMIVSHYGLKFDIPFLKYKYPDIDFCGLHFDLSFIGRKLEMGRGLKDMEKHFGITRDEDVASLDGCHAVHLWENYIEGNKESLDLLIQHNRNDTENLAVLADRLYDYLVKIDY